MELRIRIPWAYLCCVEECEGIAAAGECYCFSCLVETISNPRMCQEVSPTTLKRKTEIIHRATLRRQGGRSR